EWVSPRDQKEAMDLFGLHLAYCHALLRAVKNSAGRATFWPEVETTEALQARTARFTAKCSLKGETISKKKKQQQQQQQKEKQGQRASPYSPSSPSRGHRTNKSFCTSCSPRHEGGTASFSDDATDTLSPSPSPSPTSPSSFFSLGSARTFSSSESITEAPPCMGRRQKKHSRAKVSVSPGVAFVAYRSPTSRANPRGSSLRGSGAIAGPKIWF
ncbi:unnamed protein product, partial [Ectocarpus fasciculatus]